MNLSRRAIRIARWLVIVFLMCLAPLLPQPTVRAQTQPEPLGRRLQIAALDESSFPQVGVRVIATDSYSIPFENLDGLRLRENGVPIADFTLEEQVAGVDVAFVIDPTAAISAADSDGRTRLQTVRDSLVRFAGRYMGSDGNDVVTVVVPEGESGRTLLAESSDGAELVTSMGEYERANAGASPDLTPLVSLLERALDELSPRVESGRFQAIVLFTDGTGLNRFLFPPIVERAKAMQVPLFVAVVGPDPLDNSLQTLEWLHEPTRASFVQLTSPMASDPIYDVLEANRVQPLILYDSNLRQDGSYPVTVTLSTLRDERMLELELAAPQPEIVLSRSEIERVGTSPDSPLGELQPTTQPVPVTVLWPDGMPRRLAAATLFADGTPQVAPVIGDEESLEFQWNIAELDTGRYELMAIVTDTLGFSGATPTLAVSIELSRPEPLPTATAPATTTETPSLATNVPPPYLAGLALLALALIVVVFRRRRPKQAPAPDAFPELAQNTEDRFPSEPDATTAAGPTTAAARLEIEGKPDSSGILPGSNVTIGRNPEEVDIALDDASVSPLHARVRRRGDRFWLYDEGSERGTFLNFERLGLAPRELRPGDEIQFGVVRARFTLAAAGSKDDGSEEE